MQYIEAWQQLTESYLLIIYWPLKDVVVIFKVYDPNICYGVSSWAFLQISLKWMSQDLTGDYSTFGQVMACCRQAKNHYLNQSWPSPMTPYVVTRPHWVVVHICNNRFWSYSSRYLCNYQLYIICSLLTIRSVIFQQRLASPHGLWRHRWCGSP